MDKYYTPDISEFHVGFEYELFEDFDSLPEKIWHTQIYGKNGSNPENMDYVCIQKLKNVRVKILDRQDCEELGWKHLGAGWYDLIDVPGKLGYFTHVRFRAWDETSFIQGYRGNPAKFPDTEHEYLFQGIVKNKSAMKQLMKMLNIL